MISKAKQIEVNGFKWFYQEFRNPDGSLDGVNLYDSIGDFVTEFKDYSEMIRFLNT